MNENVRHIGDALRGVVAMQEGPPGAKERLEELKSVGFAIQELQQATASSYASAMRELVADVGATDAARQLGISRNRVYEVMRHD